LLSRTHCERIGVKPHLQTIDLRGFIVFERLLDINKKFTIKVKSDNHSQFDAPTNFEAT
jgi:hypothetical protein